MSGPRPAVRTIAAIAYFAVSTVMLVGPVYGWLGNSIEPRVLGLPWSLVYVLVVIAANFVVLAILHATHPETTEDRG